MVDREMLSAISELLDQKLEEKLEEKLEQKLEEKLEQKLDQKLDEKLDQKLDEKFDEKLKPIYDRLDKVESEIKYVRVVQLENSVIPRLNTLEQSYLDTSKRYMESTERIEEMSSDIDVLKRTVEKHSSMLNQILA